MKPRTRLSWIAVVIVASAIYAVLVKKDPDVAQAVMLGYVGVLLTIFFLNEVWKKHE
jgi:hypothetical protein